MRISEAKQCIKELYLHTNSVSALVGDVTQGLSTKTSYCLLDIISDAKCLYLNRFCAISIPPNFL